MKKIITISLTTTAALALAAPAHVDGSGGVNPSSNWNFSASAVCEQELAMVPVAGPLLAGVACEVGNVLSQGL
ncbi:hypothetical protein ABZ920_22310 [Streptomyces sp. NPDC046831]|uniref:hypothetical protein n=1 Tax=Streptomyces sp. NPDC046831 TaxID=3154805 RepID=UPI0033EE17ED